VNIKSVRELKNQTIEAFSALRAGIYAALETYSNVHRGSGAKSMISSALYEEARNIVIDHLGLDKKRYTVIFCSPARAEVLKNQLHPGSFREVSSRDTGLSLGIRALAVKSRALPRGAPFQAGGGTTRIVSPDWVVWAGIPDRFEAGTPPIINVVAFARTLQLISHYGKETFRNITAAKKLNANEILYHDELEKYSGKDLLNELRNSIIGHDLPVPAGDGLKRYINLDNAASTPAFKPVFDAFCQTLEQSSEIQKEICDEVRNICSEMLGAPRNTYEVIFTSNATESLNLAAQNLAAGTENGIENVVLSTLLEHNSNDLPWRLVPGCSIIRMAVDADGFVSLDELENLLEDYNQKCLHGNKRIRLLTISGASNVLGVVNDLAGICRIVHRYNAQLVVDAAQLVAHRKVEIEKTGIDCLVFSAHKSYAPFGCGVFIARRELLKPGPEQLDLLRSSGEENPAGIAAMGKALVLLKRAGMDIIREEEKKLTIRLLEGLKSIPNLVIYGIKDPASPSFAGKGGVVAFSHKSIFSNTIAEELARYGGIGIRYGCHCAHILVKSLVGVGPFLERFQRLIAQAFPIRFPGLARVSLGIGNSDEDVDTLIRVLGNITSRSASPVKSDFKLKMNENINTAIQNVYSKQFME
jgi:selenocysteine lyase/cysteine desulfurase